METVEQLVSFAHIQVHLSGGAPWGFTLKGGLEHGEPLIITKMEDGGKAALCEKLRVGDELININGTVLFGSRQEALILIKGSYRVLRLTVRRRSVPVLRPHSWHLDQVPEPALPPPPPPSPPCLAPADSPPLPPPPPSAMQLHPGPYTLPWHTGDHSDLSMQWGHLSRPYSATDRSSSLGSMESLDTPTPTAQTNFDCHNSPVDPALFNNKRDSAYSSFSASSNTSDYATVPLRFGEGSSMENLLQNLGPNSDASGRGLDNGQLIALKSRSLTRPRPKAIEVKERPSSCCYEDDRKVDDFGILRNGNGESTRKSNPPQPPTRKDSFRATKNRPKVSNNRCSSAPIEIANAPSYFDESSRKSVQNGFLVSEEAKEDRLESYYTQNKAPLTCSKSDAATSIYRPQRKHSTNVLHRHSAPEKLLATQLQLLEFDSDNTLLEPFIPPEPTGLSPSSCSQWSQSDKDRDSLHNLPQTSSNKWGGSRCSTPGSLFLEDGGGECTFSHERSTVNGGTTSPSQVSWGRSVSVPDEPLTLSVHKFNSEQLHERDFEPLSSASSMDTLVETKIDIVEGESATLKKSSRNLRKNRRRNERFATNLRNEIQRKKAQLQSSRGGPGGLLCSGETVHEEGPDFYEDGDPEVPERNAKVAFAPTVTDANTTTQSSTMIESSSVDSSSDVLPMKPNTNRSVQIVDPGIPSFGVGIRVVEEPAPVGKARRWRWTPENKLQPENELQTKRCGEKLFGVASSRHGVCAFTSSSTSTYPRSMSCSRMDESDLLPFADRMKFFEETSKTGVAKSAPSQPKSRPYQSENQAGELGFPTQRRYSYQGGFRQESLMEARRQSVNAKEREDRLRQREMEQKAREVEFERSRQREKEQEERMRQWEREREIERREELERLREMDRLKREKEEKERERQEYFAQRNQESQSYRQHRDNIGGFQPQASRSAFYPVNGPSQHFDNRQPQGFQARSHTPTEMFPARQQETTKLNRKYSLTERDYSSRRWESRPGPDPPQSHQSRWPHRHHDHAHSNGYGPAPPPAPLRTRAMSENDLCFDPAHHRWSPSVSVTGSQTLSEVEEAPSDDLTERPVKKKKAPPPPRPPPPKWEEFHQRRASVHGVYSSTGTQGVTDHRHSSQFEPELSRQRSYSLPPQRQDLGSNTCPTCSCHQATPPNHQTTPPNHHNPHTVQSHASLSQSHPKAPPSYVPLSNSVPAFQTLSNEIQPSQAPPPHVQSSNQNHRHDPATDTTPTFVSAPPPPSSSSSNQLPVFSIAPPSPMFSRRTFRPVAPPQRNSRGSAGEEEFPPPPPPVADDIEDDSFSDTEIHQVPDRDQDQDQVHVIKTQSLVRHTVEWERTPSPMIHSDRDSPPPPAPEPFHSMDFQQNHNLNDPNKGTEVESETTLSPSPAQSLDPDLDLDPPLETDIDDFRDEELPAAGERLDSELPCLALPVTVLETDLDLLPDPDLETSGKTESESSLLGDEELDVREGSLDEIFPQSGEAESGTESWRGPFPSTEHSTDSLDRRSGASSSCSSYYSTSTAKAQLLTQMKDFTETRDRPDHDELTYKRQLMESLRKKLGVLREAQRGLQDDIRANAQLGDEVEAMVVSVCKPNEVDKFRMFIGDLDKVVSLMLSLSGRLLRVETSLDTLDSDSDLDERRPLQEKKRQLLRQMSEAQDLKEHVDRREQAVSRVLGRCLSPDQHRDYSHFVKMKAALLVEQRQLEDKIRLGEEQLRGLRESLGLGLGVGLGLALGYGQY